MSRAFRIISTVNIYKIPKKSTVYEIFRFFRFLIKKIITLIANLNYSIKKPRGRTLKQSFIENSNMTSFKRFESKPVVKKNIYL